MLALSPVQKRVVLNLAESEPQTIHETKEKIQGHYKSVNATFHALIKKDIIKAVEKKKYRGRQFDTFWLTDYGVLLALVHGADRAILKQQVEKIYGKSDDYSLMFDFATIVSKEKFSKMMQQAYDAKKGKLSLRRIPIRNREMRKALKAMGKYPSYRSVLKELKHALTDLFDELESSEEE